ncbi:probable hexosyltransferase MUCI70 [Salvia hispanica]|uniref:probable hexosyltransferase MUCI70 n=1 Tax=Salvia hispanica TaxID=49212 RepID=UPI002008F3A8|nr:probable hexosyltransferase MUCI70 [Salvia hispanica]
MEKPTTCLQSKILCFSLFYLLSVVYLSLSSSKCNLRPPSAAPPPFSYPPSYGENKHAIPTTRSSCNSPVFFSDYSVVLKKMEENLMNSTIFGERSLRYMQGNGESFGGNLSLKERLSHFHLSDYGNEIPCGFFKPFPISDSDRTAMEKCNGVVIVTAIFNDHDKIRQPRNLGPETSGRVCFFVFVDDATMKGLYSYNVMSNETKENKIGVWRVVKVSGVDMALSRHPYFVHTIEEAMATARWKKWRHVDGLRVQMETYCENGMQPWHTNKSYPTDVPDTALILRKHSAASNQFSCLLFNELEAFNHRDQLAFAFVRDKITPKININMFEVEVFEKIAIEYRHSLKKGQAYVGPNVKWATQSLFGYEGFGKCEDYVMKMFGKNYIID